MKQLQFLVKLNCTKDNATNVLYIQQNTGKWHMLKHLLNRFAKYRHDECLMKSCQCHFYECVMWN